MELYEHVLEKLTAGTMYACLMKRIQTVHGYTLCMCACEFGWLYAGAVLGDVYQAGLSHLDSRKPELKPHLVKNFG